MLRRGKPTFASRTSDPERAFGALYTRDMMLAAEIQEQAQQHGFRVLEVDDARSSDALSTEVAAHFALA